MLGSLPNAREKSIRDYKLHLRYVALAFLQQDEALFRRRYAEWIAGLLTSLMDSAALVRAYEILQQKMQEHLDAADARDFLYSTSVFTSCLDHR